ncbi:MAG TPA: hypothetical protein VFO46_08160 [Candidatus Sulfotelmatobacter sp.]|nr:hypothetical protein [Candidatus Sulfotelmatobacter sp.]
MRRVTMVRDGEHWGRTNVKWGTSKEEKFTDTVALRVYGVRNETEESFSAGRDSRSGYVRLLRQADHPRPVSLQGHAGRQEGPT